MNDNKDETLRNELSALLSGSIKTGKSDDEIQDFNVNRGIDKFKNTNSNTQPSNPIKMLEYDKKFKMQAKSIIDSMYNFYVDYGIVDKPEYLEYKKNMDSLNVSNMLLQLKMVKIVLNKVLDDINSGNLNPRLLEVYCTLNGQMSELTRSQANYMLFLEESYKKSRIEAIENNNSKRLDYSNVNKSSDDSNSDIEITPIDDSDSEFFLTSDPMRLVEEVTTKSTIKYEDVQNERSEYLKSRGNVSIFIDPNNKNDLVENYDVDSTTIKDNDDDDESSDLLDMI